MSGWLFVALPGVGASAAAWVAYLRWKDRRRPEPVAQMVFAVAAGALAVGAALLGYGAFDALGLTASWGDLGGDWPRALATALCIGAVEEIAKLVPVVAIARLSRHFDELLDGFVYAGAAGVGFALLEAVLLLAAGETGWLDSAARLAAAPITHALFAAPAGLGLAWWVLRGVRLALPAGLALSIACHGAYDLLLARPGLRPAAAGLVLVLWLGVLLVVRKLARAPAPPR